MSVDHVHKILERKLPVLTVTDPILTLSSFFGDCKNLKLCLSDRIVEPTSVRSTQNPSAAEPSTWRSSFLRYNLGKSKKSKKSCDPETAFPTSH